MSFTEDEVDETKQQFLSSELCFTKLEIDKSNLFFRTVPNKICFDKLILRNVGTTCVYFKWRKKNKVYNISEKKSDGIDRFFCHYAELKLFPNEEKEFIFSFFSEKNGNFSEDWILSTSPPLKNEINLHVNGMCLNLTDQYSKKIEDLENRVYKNSVKTFIKELVTDLVSKVREDPPLLPNMNDFKIFKYCFEFYNKEYNVIFSHFIMKQFNNLINDIYEILQSDDRYWNGSIDKLKSQINLISDIETREEINNKLNILIHRANKNYPQFIPQNETNTESNLHLLIKQNIINLTLEIPDICNSTREEYTIPPFVFDYLTKQQLSDQELNKYNTEQNKKREEYIKKFKKKPVKGSEVDEEKEMQEYKLKFYDKTKEAFLSKFINFEEINLKSNLEEIVLSSNLFNQEYVERLSRIKSIKSIKNELIEGKIIILRIDITEWTKIYSTNEDGLEYFNYVNFPNAKSTFVESINFLLGFSPKAIIILSDFGPKLGYPNSDFEINHLIKFLKSEKLVEAPIHFLPDLASLNDFAEKYEDVDNSIFILENLNFLPEECEFEYNELGESQNLTHYSKMKFIEKFSVGSIYVNDSIKSIVKKYPTILNMQIPTRVLGFRIESQLNKFINFYLINSSNFMLILGDIEGYDILTHLMIINSLLLKFKIICIMGKLAIYFIQFLQKDYVIDSNSYLNPMLNDLIKFILIRANLNNIKIILPTDIRIIIKQEYERLINETIEDENELGEKRINYYKYIKQLYKNEKKQIRIESKSSQDDLEENVYYQSIKLTEEQIQILSNYKNNSIEFKSNEYIKQFVDLQEIKKPQKIIKSEFEMRNYLESIYRKTIVFNSSEPQGMNNLNISHISANNMSNMSNIVNVNLFNHEEYELVDYGPKTYDNLKQCIKKINCFMWIGTLGLSQIDNLFDDYLGISETVHSRKDSLVKKFNELMEEEEKKLSENDYKAKKYLLNFFLFSKKSYGLLRSSFKQYLMNNIPLEDDEEPEEIQEDDDHFNNQMNHLIDNNITEEYEFMIRLMRGEDIPGFYGLSENERNDVEEEVDLKFLEEI